MEVLASPFDSATSTKNKKMATILEMLKRIEKINISNIVVKILEEDKEYLQKENQQQWVEGKDSSENDIGRYRSQFYAADKANRPKLSDVGFSNGGRASLGMIDLIDTGQTVKSISVDISRNSIIFKIGDDRFNLEGRFGERILGMNKQSRIHYINNRLLPKLLEEIRNLTGMK